MNTIINTFLISFWPLLNILILFILGWGLTYLILPNKLQLFWFWLSPWTTIITSIFFLVILSLVGLPVNVICWLLVSIYLLIDFWVLIKIKPRMSFKVSSDLILGVIMLMVLVFNLSPLIRRDRMMTTISLGNNDVISYTTTADYLKMSSIATSFKIKTEQSTGVLLNDGYRWGTPLINSFFLTLLNFDGYQYTYTSQVVLFSLFVPLLYVFFQILFKSTNIGLLLVGILAGFNVNLLYILYHDFFGQVLFWGIEMLLFIFLYLYLNSPEIKKRNFNRYDYILGVLIAVMYFSYLEPAVFMFLPLGLYCLLKLILTRKNINYEIESFIKIGFIAIISGSISIIRAMVLTFQQAFLGNPNQPIGWQLFRQKLPFANPFEAMGFLSIHNFSPLPILLAIILSIGVILIIIKGIQKSRYKLLTLSYLIIFILFYYWTGIKSNNFFAYNRALTYTLPFIIVIFSIGLTYCLTKIKKVLSIVFLIIIIGFVAFSAIKLNKRFIAEHLSVDKSYISISKLKDQKITEPVYIESHINDQIPLWKQIWTGYFLYSKQTAPAPTVFINQEYHNRVPDNSLVLLSSSTPWIKSPNILFKEVLWNNDYYQLGRLCNSDECLITSDQDLSRIDIGKNSYEDSLLISGWFSTEGETRWANDKESTLRLVTKDGYPTSLVVEVLSLKSPQTMTVYIDNQLINTISIGTEWKEYVIPINYPLNLGVHKVKFVYDKDYRPIDVIPGNLDTRTLYVNFKKIALE